MAKKHTRTLSDADKALLATYLRLPPEDREKVIAYAALLREAQRIRPPSGGSPL